MPLDENDKEIIELFKDKKAIVILNKNGLAAAGYGRRFKGETDHPVVAVSMKEEEGIENLEAQIKRTVF